MKLPSLFKNDQIHRLLKAKLPKPEQLKYNLNENPNQQLDVSCPQLTCERLHNSGKAQCSCNNDPANYIGCHSTNKAYDLTL